MPKTRADLFQRLAELGIQTTTHDHPPVMTVEESKELHETIPGWHSKNLFLKDAKGTLWLVVAEAMRPIDLKKLPDAIGSKRLSFGSADLLVQVLGVQPGSVTPFALINDVTHRVNVVLDRSMFESAAANFHPLENTATTSIAPNDLVRFIESCGHTPRYLD